MVVKILEIRDSATFIPVMAIKLTAGEEAEHYLLRRAGYSEDQMAENKPSWMDPYVILVKLVEVEAHYDAFEWPNRRTMTTAHRFIIEHFDSIQPGDVIDVEYILGEAQTVKTAERLTHPMV